MATNETVPDQHVDGPDLAHGLPVDPDLLPGDPGEPSWSHHPIRHVHRGRRRDVIGFIAFGGFLGTVARFAVTLAWPTARNGFPWSTCAINISGAFLIGVVLTAVLEGLVSWRRAQPLFCTGFLGSWTTMSSFAMASDLLVGHGFPGTALAYVVVTTAIGLLATWGGMRVGRSLAPEKAA